LQTRGGAPATGLRFSSHWVCNLRHSHAMPAHARSRPTGPRARTASRPAYAAPHADSSPADPFYRWLRDGFIVGNSPRRRPLADPSQRRAACRGRRERSRRLPIARQRRPRCRRRPPDVVTSSPTRQAGCRARRRGKRKRATNPDQPEDAGLFDTRRWQASLMPSTKTEASSPCRSRSAPPKSPGDSPCRYRIGSASVTFGERRAYAGRIFELIRLRSPVSSSTRLSWTRGARTGSVHEPTVTRRSRAWPLRTTSRLPSSPT
jgi:hypothetical protein